MTSREKWFFGIVGFIAVVYNILFIGLLPYIDFINTANWLRIIIGFCADIAIIIGIIAHIWKKRLITASKSIDDFIGHYLQEDDFILNNQQRHVLSNDEKAHTLINNTFNKYLNIVQTIEQEIRQVNTEISAIIEKAMELHTEVYRDYGRYINQNKGELSQSSVKLHRLNAEKAHLDELYEKKQEIKKRRDKVQIILNEKSDELLEKYRSSFKMLCDSKKKYGVETDIELDDLLSQTPPRGLKLFSCTNEPIILNTSDERWCIYSKAILVFSKQDCFIGAYNKNCFSIEIERMKKNLFVSNDNPSTKYDRELDVDSRCISTGTTQYHWEHERNDGMPDQRYKDNRLNKYRNDLMEYGQITFSLNNLVLKYVFSSSYALNALEDSLSIIPENCSNKDRILSLLQLIDLVSSHEDSANLLSKYSQKAKTNSYCYLTVE